jgi:hypothetical protein
MSGHTEVRKRGDTNVLPLQILHTGSLRTSNVPTFNVPTR